MASSNIIVGVGDCSIPQVISHLRSSATFASLHDKWTYLAIDLNTSRELVKRLKRDYLLDKINLGDVLCDLIEEWVGRRGSEATLHQLISVLEENGLKNCAESLEIAFPQFSSLSPRKYRDMPSGLQDILAGSKNKPICIILTLDMSITCDRIMEERQDCTVHKYEEYLNIISAPPSKGTEREGIKVVTVTNIRHLRQLVMNVASHVGQPIIVTPKAVKDDLTVLFNSEPSWEEKVDIIQDHLLWNDLTFAHQHQINLRLEETFKMEFEMEELGPLLEGQVLVHLINGKDLKLFKDTLPKKLSYYVERMILTRDCISPKIFEQGSHSPDVFIFTGIERYELSGFTGNIMTDNSTNQIRQERLTSRHLILDQLSHFDKICGKTEDPVHWLRFEKGRFRWMRSRGGMHSIQRCIDDSSQSSINEGNFNQDSNQPICISDSPGMGKSVLLAQIGRKLKEKHPERLVVFVVLSELIHQMKSMKGMDTPTRIMKALQTSLCENVVGEAMLKSKLNSTGEVLIELLLDGFDEVDSSDSNYAHGVLQTLNSSFNSVRLWLTSRPHFLEELENNLNQLGYNIQPFREDDQIQFLTSFWSRDQEVEVDMANEKIKQFSKICLNSLKSRMNSKDHDYDIAGIPLQCLLIGEVYEEEALEYAKRNEVEFSSTLQIQIETIASLYQRLIQKKFQKYRMTYGGAKTKLEERDLLALHARLGLELVLPKSFETLMRDSGSSSAHDTREEAFKVGILESVSSSLAPRFLHRTFAEYFVAWYVVDTLHGDPPEEALKEFLFDDVLASKSEHTRFFYFVHPVITYFINSLLGDQHLQPFTTNVAAHLSDREFSYERAMIEFSIACVCADFFNMLKFFNQLKIFEPYGASVFDDKLLWMTFEKAGFDMVKMVLTHFQRYHKFDLNIQNRALHEAMERGEFSMMEYLIKEKGLRRIVQVFNEETRKLLHSCVIISSMDSQRKIQQKIQVIRMLVKINPRLLEVKMEDGTTPLIAGRGHILILLELIKLGADVLVQDKWNESVLHLYSSDHLTSEEYHVLVQNIPKEKLGLLVQCRGRKGDTPLLRLIRYRDPVPETLEIFRTNGANFSSQDDEGYSALALAIKNERQTGTLRKLLECGSQTDWLGVKGETLPHLAATSEYADAVRILVEDYDGHVCCWLGFLMTLLCIMFLSFSFSYILRMMRSE